MRGTAALSSTKTKFKQIYRLKGTGGSLPTLTPKKQENNVFGEEKPPSTNGNNEPPIVTFTKPPPLPPVFGPLVGLSLLETWSSRDNNDD